MKRSVRPRSIGLVTGVTERWCGASRPGHFRGVATVVMKLFALARPNVAFFGQKDYQQTVVIRRMVEELFLPVKIRVLPTVREEDGLAKSSRNAYLDADERRRALGLHRALEAARAKFADGEFDTAVLLAIVEEVLAASEITEVEYIQGRWVPTRVVFRDMLKTGGGTEFTIESIQFDAAIPAYTFSKAALR